MPINVVKVRTELIKAAPDEWERYEAAKAASKAAPEEWKAFEKAMIRAQTALEAKAPEEYKAYQKRWGAFEKARGVSYE